MACSNEGLHDFCVFLFVHRLAINPWPIIPPRVFGSTLTIIPYDSPWDVGANKVVNSGEILMKEMDAGAKPMRVCFAARLGAYSSCAHSGFYTVSLPFIYITPAVLMLLQLWCLKDAFKDWRYTLLDRHSSSQSPVTTFATSAASVRSM